MKTVYLDNNATTPIASEVQELMMPFITDYYGNPSSLHDLGRISRKAIEQAREQTAACLKCNSDEVIFTGGGSESNNAAIMGILQANPGKKHIITTQVEHYAIGHVCQFMEQLGYEVTYLPVDKNGKLDLDVFKKSIRTDTVLVTVMWANNETGVIFPVQDMAKICRENNIYFHTDAVQTAGKLPIQLQNSQIDLLSLSGHKFHAPKGVGVLYIRKGIRWQPYLRGGSQELGKRAGTENVMGITAFGKAFKLACEYQSKDSFRLESLRDSFENEISQRIPDLQITGKNSSRLSNTSHICFKNAKDYAILLMLNEVGICASSGSACSMGSGEVSHVLQAMNVPQEYIHGAIRISLSRYTTREDIDILLEHLPGIIVRARKAYSDHSSYPGKE